jgi:hypothetical protein
MNTLQAIREWYIKNDTKITWFLIGYNLLATVEYVAQQDWSLAAITAVIVIALVTADQAGVQAQ